jgi:hypothetical protein
MSPSPRHHGRVRGIAELGANVTVVIAVFAFPVVVVILAVDGHWGPAAGVGLAWVMSWWKSRHDGRYVPASLRARWLSRRA